MLNSLIFLVTAVLVAPSRPQSGEKSPYQKDVEFLLQDIQESCPRLLKVKEINWEMAKTEFNGLSAAVQNEASHYDLLRRLLARLKDGQAQLLPPEAGASANFVDPTAPPNSPGLYCYWQGEKLFVKSSWGAADKFGLRPGVELIQIDRKPAQKWFEEKLALLRQRRGFSTEAQANYYTLHWGLNTAQPLKVYFEFRGADGKTKKASLDTKPDTRPLPGPPRWLAGIKVNGGLRYAKTKKGFGYIHLDSLSPELLTQIDAVLKELGNVPGMMIDFRGGALGSCDWRELLCRFFPTGKTFRSPLEHNFTGEGPNPFGGPMVVLVDAGVQGEAELGCGLFKEEGRAYLIGETHTAGSCAKTKTLNLLSGLGSVRFSVETIQPKWNGAMGIEGFGVFPHEIVEYDSKDLAKGEDSLILKAESLLQKFPAEKVPYRP